MISGNLITGFYRFSLLILTGLFFLTSAPSFSQIYGLTFSSHNVSKDLRTELDLSPNQFYTFSGDFELAFTLNIRREEGSSFGYICRIITKNNSNIDLIFNNSTLDSNDFRVTSGQKLILKYSYDIKKISNGWLEYRLKVNLDKNSVTFITPDSILTGSGIDFHKTEDVKILFGASDFGQFKTTDTPPMNLRDIMLFQNGVLKHHWPLDEVEGNTAADLVGRKKAGIRNPNWIKLSNYNWEFIYEAELEGVAQVAFDSENENVILIGQDKVIRFGLGTEKPITFIPHNSDINLLSGRQAFYDPLSKKVYSYNIDKPSVSSFDFNKLVWSRIDSPASNLTIYGHHNKYYSSKDGNLFVFGGYGQHTYKNTVQQYNLRTNELETLKTSGDFFSPRYLSALGELNDTVYILGGFGSTTGEQIFNPHDYYDMMAFSLKDHIFKKKFEYITPLTDMSFANSMYIDPADRNYYALAFPNYKYDGYLQLIRGSLNSPVYSIVGSKIPYSFLDKSSFADLFYGKRNDKLVAVTILSENGKSRIRIYSLVFPPDNLIGEALIKKTFDFNLTLFLIVFLVIIGGIICINYLVKSKRKKRLNLYEAASGENMTEPLVPIQHLEIKPSSVLFFGGFHAIDKTGKDITRMFSPLLKELFLFLWVKSMDDGMGVTSEDLIETLWFDLPEARARNNRGVNIAKLKTVLDEIGNCELSNKTGFWKIEVNYNYLFNDYYEFIKLTNSKKRFTREEIERLLAIVHGGAFLHSLKYDWLDEISSNISNQIIDKLLTSIRSLNIEKETDLVITLSDYISKFDNINEEAMIAKCQALTILGRNTLAINTFNKFTKEYKILLGVEFDKSFSEILK